MVYRQLKIFKVQYVGMGVKKFGKCQREKSKISLGRHPLNLKMGNL
jgi:hypothetical protein